MPFMRGRPSIAVRVVMLAAVGMFISVQQARSESVFGKCRERAAAPPEMRIPAPEPTPVFSAAADTLGFAVVDEDTLETFDVEIEEAKEPSKLFKEIAAFTIAVAMVSYFVITLIGSGDEEQTSSSGNGKTEPKSIAAVRIPITQ